MHRQIEADGGMLAYRGLVIAGCIRRSRNTEMKRSGIEVRRGEKEAMHRHGGNANLQSLRMAQWLSWLERRPVTAKVEGSSPFWVVNGILAQLGEHLPYKQRVTGSSPVGPIFYVK